MYLHLNNLVWDYVSVRLFLMQILITKLNLSLKRVKDIIFNILSCDSIYKIILNVISTFQWKWHSDKD